MGERRVALLLQDLSGGGAERVMANLANGLVEAGEAVDVVLVRKEGPNLARLDDRLRVIDLNTRRTIWSLPALVRYLRRERPVAMLSPVVHVNVLAVAAAKLARVSTRVVVAGHTHASIDRQRVAYRTVRWAYHLAPLAYRLADRVVGVSQGMADDMASVMRLERKRIEVLCNPVVGPWVEQAASEPVEHPWFASGGPPVLLNVGRLNEPKDHRTLLRAFMQLRERVDARLAILGEGPLRPELETLADQLGVRGHTWMPGFVNNPYAYMKRASAFVLSSQWEALPTVLIEALACGTPVVSTDCRSGPREILAGGRFGELVPVGSPAALAEAMQRVLAEPRVTAEEAETRAAAFSVNRAVAAYRHLLLSETS